MALRNIVTEKEARLRKVSRPVETGVRREYATDQKWLHTTLKTIVERIRFDRLQKG